MLPSRRRLMGVSIPTHPCSGVTDSPTVLDLCATLNPPSVVLSPQRPLLSDGGYHHRLFLFLLHAAAFHFFSSFHYPVFFVLMPFSLFTLLLLRCPVSCLSTIMVFPVRYCAKLVASRFWVIRALSCVLVHRTRTAVQIQFPQALPGICGRLRSSSPYLIHPFHRYHPTSACLRAT